MRGFFVGVLAGLAVGVAVILWRSAGAPEPGTLGALQATPEIARLTLRVGKRAEFTAAADGALRYNWSLSGAPVSQESAWSYVPAPEDAGVQQVKVLVNGPNGMRLRRVWDVVVESPLAPEVVETTPPTRDVWVREGETARFRCAARMPVAEPSAQLRFTWSVNDEAAFEDERPAVEGASESEFEFPASKPGLYRIVARVRDVDAIASLTEWTVIVAPSEQPRLVRATGPRRLAPKIGEKLALAVRVEPEAPDVSYRWSVNGQRIEGEAAPRLDFEATQPGRHRIMVTALEKGRQIGHDAWIVNVQRPAPVPEATPPVEVAAVERRPEPQPREEPREEPPPPSREPAQPAAPHATPAAPEPRPAAVERTRPSRAEPERAPAPERAPMPEPPPPAVVASAPPPSPPSPPASPPSSGLLEDEVRRWLEEYARAWSRKDLDALRRMGQVRSAAQVEQLERYFKSIDELRVDVRVLALRIDGSRASVEFERTDTLTDPGGARREMRLPPLRKQIERSPQGLRFTEQKG